MSARVMMERIAGASPRLKARIAGVSSLLAILTGVFASFVAHGSLSLVAELIAGLFYVVTTLLLYDILKAVNRGLSLLAAFFGLVVCTIGACLLYTSGTIPYATANPRDTVSRAKPFASAHVPITIEAF